MNLYASISEPNFAFKTPLWEPSCSLVRLDLGSQILHPKRHLGNPASLLYASIWGAVNNYHKRMTNILKDPLGAAHLPEEGLMSA